MTKLKRKRTEPVETEFDEVVARLLQTDPEELAASIAEQIEKQRAAAEKQILDARKEIQNGARPRQGRFRL
ncbi:MAG: hypothetical protein ACLQUZ_01405 [Rhizomicrobium sp.]